MKAAQISAYGDVSALTIQNIETPTVHSGEVLVEVHAASLNPVDNAILKGYMKDMMPLNFPATLGGDIAGTVVEVADDVTAFTVGDRVFGQSMAPGNSGALAEQAVTSAQKLALLPEGVEFESVASLPLAGASALQALNTMDLAPGKKIFINGGNGGIGSIAIQVAKSRGAYVATTATSQYADQLRSLGADEVIDYRTDNFSDILFEYDAVLDNAGADFAAITKISKDDGVIVSLTGSVDGAEAEKRNINATNQFTQVTSEVLKELAGYVENGTLKPQIGARFILDDIIEAFQQLENGSVLGKIVVSVK